MNPLQYINKIFCTLLFFSTGNKSYSQREIHPLEPMFTYDYALKYYGNIMAHSITSKLEYYWYIENFKAPANVEKIIVHEDFPYYSLFREPKIINGHGKDIFTFNPLTGFLIKSKRLNEKKVIVSESTYEYDFGEIDIEIIVHTTNYQLNIQNNIKYIFDNKTKSLKKVINYPSATSDSQEVVYEYLYTMINSQLPIINNIKINGEKIESDNNISFTKDTINYIDVENKRFFFNQDYSVLEGTNGIIRKLNLIKEDYISYNKKIKSLKPFLYPIATIRRNSKVITGTLSFGENFIYYGNVNSKPHKHPTERRVLLLFDNRKELMEKHVYEFGYSQGSSSRYRNDGIENWHYSSKDWNYRVLSKKNSKKWILDYYGERKENDDVNSVLIYQITDSNSFRKQSNKIYYGNHTSLIYMYN